VRGKRERERNEHVDMYVLTHSRMQIDRHLIKFDKFENNWCTTINSSFHCLYWYW